MQTLVNILTPEQTDAILAAYDTIAEWYAQVVNLLADTASNIVVEDLFI